MQVWEAFYEHFYDIFFSEHNFDICCMEIARKVKDMLLLCDKSCYDGKSYETSVRYTNSTIDDYSPVFQHFNSFLKMQCSKSLNWKCWHDFVFKDVLAYVGLYLTIRGGMWDMRIGSLKEMCPLFTEFDRLNYRKIIPQHISDIHRMPEHIKRYLCLGGFVCCLNANSFSAVGAHEMCINKNIKATIVRSSKEYLNRVMYYFPVRAEVCKNLKSQVNPTTSQTLCLGIIDNSPHRKKCEHNVSCMKDTLVESHVFDILPEPKGLQAIGGVFATPEQERDMMSFRDIGKDSVRAYVEHFIVGSCSAKVPVRLKRLQTFSSRKKVEKKIVSRCIRRELAWSAQTHNSAQKSRGEQYLELPRALCTHDAIPHKGQKSFATKFFEARYKDLMMCSYPAQWVPDIVILEGMFLINTSPLITHSSMKDYARFLIKRFTIPHFIKGVIQVHILFDNPIQVHILFDNPGCIPNTPKAVEQRRRDSAHALSPEHQHYEVFDSAAVPSNWRDCLHCRSCKRRLVLYIG